MTPETLAAPGTGAQDHFSQRQKTAGDRLSTLRALPLEWRPALLAIGRNKQPIDSAGRPLRQWPSSPPPSTALMLRAPAVGLRTGAISSTLCLDFDGEEAWATFRELFGGDPAALLPRTISWTSGKPGRCQMAFRIAPDVAHALKGKRRTVGTLELRWDGQQSVLTGHHPETGAYRWLKHCEPWRCPLADFPAALLRALPAGRSAEGFRPPPPRPAGGTLVVPLEAFVTFRTRALLETGSIAGQCNDDGIRLSLDLVAAEAWLKEQGVGVERSAQELFEQYCRQCPQKINGKPFDRRAMQARFDGAVKRCPVPPTPDEKLRERLDYHRRMARRNRQEVAA